MRARSRFARLLAQLLVPTLVCGSLPVPARASLPPIEASAPELPSGDSIASAVTAVVVDTAGAEEAVPRAVVFAVADPHLPSKYHRARWMDPGAGRFVGMDPFPGLAFESSTLHKYLYASANPINTTDPTGLFNLSVSLTLNVGLTTVNAIAAFNTGGANAAFESLLFDAVLLGSIAGGVRLLAWAWRQWRAARTTVAIVRASDAAFSQAVYRGAEAVSGFKIWGVKGLVGDAFVRSIVLIEAANKGRVSLSLLTRALEAEARAAGATQLRIVGHAVINSRLLNPQVAARLGYSFRQLSDDAFELVKVLSQ